MATNLNNVPLPANEWVDLYSATGIPVGVPIIIENTGSSDIRLSVRAAQPAQDTAAYNQSIRNGFRLVNHAGDPGAWAYSANTDGELAVSEQSENGFIDASGAALERGLGRGKPLDAWGNQLVSENYSLFHGLFTFDIPPSMWLLFEDGVENIAPQTWTAATSSLGALRLISEGGQRLLSSRRHPRYQPNRGLRWAASIFLPNPTADGIRDFGLFTPDNGFFFRLRSTGLYAVRKTGSVIEQEELIDLPFAIDFSKGNIFDIQAQIRGVGNVKFFIGNPDTGQVQKVHEFNLLGTLSTMSTEEPSLSVAFQVERGTEDVELRCGCVDMSSEGGGIDREQFGSAFAAGVISGVDTPVLIIYQPQTVGGKYNTRDIRLARVTGASDKRAIFKVWTTRDLAAITGATFAPINPNGGSFLESDSPNMNPASVRATAVNLNLLSFVTALRVAANLDKSIENPARDSIDFFLVHGDYLIITCDTSNASADAIFEWGEEI